jgi:hypothetical protein
MTKKINLDIKIKGLDGKEIDQTLATILSGILIKQNEGDAIKLHDFALKAFNDKAIIVDDADSKMIKGLINSSKDWNVLAKAPLLKALDGGEEVK